MRDLETQAGRLNHSIGMLLLPGFNGAAALSFLDPFRAANYIQGEKLYHWHYLSLSGNPVTASNEVVINNTEGISLAKMDFDLIVVNASWAPEKYQSKKLQKWLTRAANRGLTLASMDTGAFVLAYAGLLNNYRATVHYEHLAAFTELFPQSHAEDSIYVGDRDRLSCCGGTAASHLAIRLIQKHHGMALANASANYLFIDRHRAGNEKQTQHDSEPVGHTMPQKLREAIILMERNLEEPLLLTEVADLLGISQRQLARVFNRETGMTPVRYYINIRLDRARGLITQTSMRIAEVANACGFGSYEQFSRSYFSRFGITPGNDRTEGRIPFQFRSSHLTVDYTNRSPRGNDPD